MLSKKKKKIRNGYILFSDCMWKSQFTPGTGRDKRGNSLGVDGPGTKCRCVAFVLSISVIKTIVGSVNVLVWLGQGYIFI
jgi:hypothetical protein